VYRDATVCIDRLRVDKRDRIPPPAPIDGEISDVDCDHPMPRVQFAQADQTKMCQIGGTVRVSIGQLSDSRQVIRDVEGLSHETVPHKF
jgi:hypothetical protein